MASLRKKVGSPFWFACFTLPDGTRTQRSTKTVERKTAQRLAFEWEEAGRQRITEGQARRVLSEVIEKIHGKPLASATVAEYVAQWLGRKQGETAPATFSAYKHTGEEFGGFLGERANRGIHYITTSDVAGYRDFCAKKATPNTANHKLKIVRVLMQSAWRDGLISENPAAKVQPLRASESKRRAFRLTELKRLLALANDEWRGLILFGLYTGQRLGDIAALTWNNVDLQNRELRLVTGKTGRQQIIPIASPLEKFLESLPSSDDTAAPLFPNAHAIVARHGRTGTLSQQFNALAVAAGLAKPNPGRQSSGNGRDRRRELNELSFHSLRHTATSLLKVAGVSEAVARDIIGHESAAISRHYTHVDEDAKRAALEKLPDVMKAK